MPRGLAHDHDEKRALIRRGAARYFAQHGYDRASMAGAARACGVSKALLYHYHASKEALLADILDAHLSRLVAVVAEVPPGPPEPRLRALVLAILTAYRDADAEHKLQADALATLPREAQKPLIALQLTLVAKMAEALAALRPDLPESRLRPVTMSLFGMLNWFYMWHRPGRTIAREAYADLACTLMLGGLAALS